MNKKYIRIIAVLMLVISILFLMNPSILASTSGDDIKTEADNWLIHAKEKSPITPTKVGEILNPIANILIAIGSVVLLVVGVVIAIRYMSASPDQKGHLKIQLMGLFISAIVLYGAYGIWSIVYTVLKELLG